MNKINVNSGSEFYIRAIWDEENKIWYSDTNIEGLFIEAKTREEFAEVANEFAEELIEANHSAKHEKKPREYFWVVPIGDSADTGVAAA